MYPAPDPHSQPGEHHNEIFTHQHNVLQQFFTPKYSQTTNNWFSENYIYYEALSLALLLMICIKGYTTYTEYKKKTKETYSALCKASLSLYSCTIKYTLHE